jgi:very-short-patch-repair endonuclease
MTRLRPAGAESHFVVAKRAAVQYAGRQHGIVTLSHLYAAGLSRGAVRHLVSTGWLRRIHRGVYVIGAVEPPLARSMAAVLGCGDGALLSHYPAAVLWVVRPGPAPKIHVTVPGRHVEGPEGVTVHRVKHLHPRDITRRHGIPVTSLARTLLDIAPHTTPRQLARAADEARIQHGLSDDSLNAQFARYPNHRGVSALRRATAREPRLTRSYAERRLLELIREAGLPEPQTNVTIAGHEVDFFWPALSLAVEVDGYAFHSTRAAFERDRRRDADLQAHGIDTLRVTWTQIARESLALVALLAAAYGQRRRGSRN